MKTTTVFSFDTKTHNKLKGIARANFFWTLPALFAFAPTTFKHRHPTEWDNEVAERHQSALEAHRPRQYGVGHVTVSFCRADALKELLRDAVLAGMGASEYVARMTLRYAEQHPEDFKAQAQKFQAEEKERLSLVRGRPRKRKTVPSTEPIAIVHGKPIFASEEQEKKSVST